MTKHTRPTYSADFKLEAAQLVVDGTHSARKAAELMNVSNSAIDKWVRQLKQERNGGSVHSSTLTPDKIKELEK